jgi:hypothetical protein
VLTADALLMLLPTHLLPAIPIDPRPQNTATKKTSKYSSSATDMNSEPWENTKTRNTERLRTAFDGTKKH